MTIPINIKIRSTMSPDHSSNIKAGTSVAELIVTNQVNLPVRLNMDDLSSITMTGFDVIESTTGKTIIMNGILNETLTTCTTSSPHVTCTCMLVSPNITQSVCSVYPNSKKEDRVTSISQPIPFEIIIGLPKDINLSLSN